MKKSAAIIITIAMAISLFVGTGITAFAASSGGTGGTGGGTVSKGNEYVAPDDPALYIYSAEKPIFKAGDTLSLPMVLNVSEAYAQNVRMRLTGPEGYENDFSFYSQSGSFNAPDVSDKTVINPFVQVTASVPDGTYRVKVSFNYTREATSFKCDDYIMITVHGRSTEVLRVSKAIFETAEIGVDNKSVLSVDVLNPSNNTYNDVSLSLNSANSKGFSLYQNFLPANAGTMEAKAAAKLKFYVYVESTVVSGNYSLVFDLTYKNQLGDVVSSKETIPVQVKRSADASGKGNVPRIIISNYKTDVEQIKAGKEFTLDFSLKNTSEKTTVRNIKVVLSSSTTSGTGGTGGSGGNSSTSGDVFFAAAGSNSFYISSIAPGGTASQSIKLMSKQDVEPGVYSVHLKIDYEDETGNTIPSAEEQVSFAISQEQRLEIQSMNIPTDGMSGSPIPINFQYINKGKATIYNLSVTVEGGFSMEGGSSYIGNLTAGYNDYFDSAVTPTGEGEQKGTIVLKYEDASGEVKEHRSEFTCNVSAAGAMGGMTGDVPMGGGEMGGMIEAAGGGMQPNQGTNSLIWWIGIPVVLLLAGGIVTVIILKKRKAKKAMVTNEED